MCLFFLTARRGGFVAAVLGCPIEAGVGRFARSPHHFAGFAALVARQVAHVAEVATEGLGAF